MRQVLVAAVTLLYFALPAYTFAQTSNATVGGTVSDATGALIPGVTITATNVGTGIVNTVITSEAGAYNFPSLQTGTYRVGAELSGFQTQTYEGVTLGFAQQVRLNFMLLVSAVAQAVEVTVAADTLIATTSASVGTVLSEYRVRELPLANRNVMELLATTGGTGPQEGERAGYFAGGRLSAVNTTRDGMVVSDGRYTHGAYSNAYISPDLVEEMRIITAPADAEAGRGAGQVQLVTRSGTNQFRGSVFGTNRNSALDAANWFNNFRGVNKNYENRNQWGARLGGPIRKNKTFFFVLVEGQRNVEKQDFVGMVLTEPARQGIFRFFPGADNQNAISLRPTVDFSGNPVRPANAAGDLTQFSVFNRDPFRPGYDPTGFIQNVLLSRMPPPNDYTIGDGLNTAGHRFTRRIYGLDVSDGQGTFDKVNRDQFNVRLDHHFTPDHGFSFIYTWERNIDNSEQAGIPNWPDLGQGHYYGAHYRWPTVLATSLVSTFSPTVVNELRVGYKDTKLYTWDPHYVGREFEDPASIVGKKGQAAFDILPKLNGLPYRPVTRLFPANFTSWTGRSSTRYSISPQYTFADTVSWEKGAHSFRVGAEWRAANSRSGNEAHMTPMVELGPGGVPVRDIDNIAIPGLTGNNQTLARDLLTDLSGSVHRITQAFDVIKPTDPIFSYWGQGVYMKDRAWYTNEASWFFKDTWKAGRNLTLNYGIHWEWFGVPWERRGLAGAPSGGATEPFAGLCGISCGGLTRAQFVGKNSPNPDIKLHNNDFNNFAPAFGLSWSIPWWGQDKTVLRVGYGWSYTGGGLKNTSQRVNFISGGFPGTFGGSGVTGWEHTQAAFLSLANLTLPIPRQFAPLEVVPLDGFRSDTIVAYDPRIRDPYIQNFNFGIQRELGRNWTLDVAYVGTKGTRLWGDVPLNVVNIDAALPGGQTFVDAFNVTRSGGNAPLFDRMLVGMNIPGAGVVNGTTVTGSAALRAYVSTRALIANGNAGGLADFLDRSRNITNKGGGFVRNSRLFPENFFVLNPQFRNPLMATNPSSSTYHSLQVQMTKRLSQGFTTQGTYTWSRSLGDADDDDRSLFQLRDPRNRSLDKALLGFHRTHNITTNGVFELPFGPNRRFLGDAPRFLQRLAERWQFAGIFSWTSGAPLTISAPISTIWQYAANMTPNVAGDFPKNIGQVTRLENGVTLFPGIQQITDPARANVSPLNALQGSFSNKAITDSQGRLLLLNPAPGEVGTLGLRWVQGPSRLRFDVSLTKRVRITETKEFELRVDAINVPNRPNFSPPAAGNLNINSAGFGRITSADGNRRFLINARVNF